MNDLRWILIAFGALLLVGIYFWGRRGNRRTDDADSGVLHPRSDPQVEPAFDASPYRLEDDDASPVDDADPYEAPADEQFVTRAPVRKEPEAWKPRSESPARVEIPSRASRGARVEPTLGDGDVAPLPESAPLMAEDPASTVESPVNEPADVPTLGMSSTPAPRRIERRKIIALRLAAPGQRFPGEVLRGAMEAESLQFGRYDVFHRLHEDGLSVFSVASMMEPGTFELDRMAGQQYSGVTMFAQLPGPLPGVEALSDLVECGKRLQTKLGGTLQDERGVPLTAHRIDRLRQEVIEFERAQARDQRPTSVPN